MAMLLRLIFRAHLLIQLGLWLKGIFHELK